MTVDEDIMEKCLLIMNVVIKNLYSEYVLREPTSSIKNNKSAGRSYFNVLTFDVIRQK